MKISRRDLRSITGRIMMGLALAAMIGGMGAAPSFADDGRGGRRYYGDRERGHDRGRYEHRGRGYDHDRGRRVYRPYVVRERVYVPPPVYYEPPPPPGIHIFFPPIIFR